MDPIQFTSPVMRVVQGSFFEPNTTDMQGNPLVVKTGPNKGAARVEYFVAGAIAKNDPNWPPFEALIKGYAAQAWPQYFPQGPLGQCTHPNFSMKIMDGDGFDGNGQPNSAKEWFAGCWVVKFSTGFAPTVYPAGRFDRASIITDKNLCKLGYYYRIAGTISSNENAQRPGVYVNFGAAELVGYGEEIIPKAAIDPRQAFGQPAALPAGARPTPAGAPSAQGGQQFAAAPVASAPPVSTPVATASPTNAAPPYSGYMAPPAPPAGPTMTPKANGVTYEAYRAAGWSDDQLRQNGLMI